MPSIVLSDEELDQEILTTLKENQVTEKSRAVSPYMVFKEIKSKIEKEKKVKLRLTREKVRAQLDDLCIRRLVEKGRDVKKYWLTKEGI